MRRSGKIWEEWARVQEVLDGHPDGWKALSVRQAQVVRHIRSRPDASTNEIGRELGITSSRVRQIVGQVRGKLELFLTDGCLSRRQSRTLRRRKALLQILNSYPELRYELTELQRRAIEKLEEQPAATQEELGRAMGLSGFAWKSHFNGVVNRVERTTGIHLED